MFSCLANFQSRGDWVLPRLWWNWQFGYKFARIDLQRPPIAQAIDKQKHEGHGDEEMVGQLMLLRIMLSDHRLICLFHILERQAEGFCHLV